MKRAARLTFLLLACDPRKEAADLASAATAKADALSSAAKDQARSAARDGLRTAKRELFGLTDTGALSQATTDWISKQADGDAALAVVSKGVQLAPVAVEAAKVLNQAVDDETAIEPIFQKVERGKEQEVDEAIGKMPKVEVIDGVKVGFKKLDQIETSKVTKEQAAVVLWRKDDHVVGFVYRTKRTIDLEVLVKEAPRLIKLTQSAMK